MDIKPKWNASQSKLSSNNYNSHRLPQLTWFAITFIIKFILLFIDLPPTSFAHNFLVFQTNLFAYAFHATLRYRLFSAAVVVFCFLFFLSLFQITNILLQFGVAGSHNWLAKKLTKIVWKHFETDTQRRKIIKKKENQKKTSFAFTFQLLSPRLRSSLHFPLQHMHSGA